MGHGGYHMTMGDIQRAAWKKKQRIMNAPERMAQERQFELEHAGDSDQELYAYAREIIGRHGRSWRVTEEQVVGSVYLIRRLGPWPEIRWQALDQGRQTFREPE